MARPKPSTTAVAKAIAPIVENHLARSRASLRAEILAELSVIRKKSVPELIATAVAEALQADPEDATAHKVRLQAADFTARAAGVFDDVGHDPVRHLHLHLDAGVSRFVVLHGRYPTEAERHTLGLPAAPKD